MPGWAATLVAAALATACVSIGFIVHLAIEVATLKERVASLGRQLMALPKRKGDS